MQIRYIGGPWVWLEFDTVEACQRHKENEEINCYFKEMKPVTKDFVMDERIVWIEVVGLPLCGWMENSFNKVIVLVGGKECRVMVKEIAVWSPSIKKPSAIYGEYDDVLNSMKRNLIQITRYSMRIHFRNLEEEIDARKKENDEEFDASKRNCDEDLDDGCGCEPKILWDQRGKKSYTLNRRDLEGSMGYDMKGSQKNLKKLIRGMGENFME
ncbi:hypothetical protein L1987_57382 [Smallanthus sonchifolius]|uniref:Uncharacterized protein n=1 Tax=Smallanthus sonchifolius TaxID=185202 RepID=A0ACB9DCG4_9ASTR|nr:hypothetical protein L1987_57382 [Smallanthus sonchifolius]